MRTPVTLERIAQTLPAGYALAEDDDGWWVIDAAGAPVFGPRRSASDILDAWADHESRPAQ